MLSRRKRRMGHVLALDRSASTRDNGKNNSQLYHRGNLDGTVLAAQTLKIEYLRSEERKDQRTIVVIHWVPKSVDSNMT